MKGPPTPYWQKGPRAGQPKICRLCPTPVYVNERRAFTHCRFHYLQKMKAYTFPYKRNSPERLARAIRALTPSIKSPDNLQTLKQRTFNGDGNYFDHLPLEQKEIAEYELQVQLRKHPDYTKIQLAQMVGRSIAYAKCGGKKRFDAKGRRMISARRHWRDMLLHHPEDLPAGLDLSNLPSAKPKR